MLAYGAVASVRVASIPWAGSGYHPEVYGREGTLVATSADSPQLGTVQLQGTRTQDLHYAPTTPLVACRGPGENAMGHLA